MWKFPDFNLQAPTAPIPDSPSALQHQDQRLNNLFAKGDLGFEGTVLHEDVFRSVPNLKKLGIEIELHPEGGAETLRCLEHIGALDELESLKCVAVNPFKFVVAPPNQDHFSNLPDSLKKLSLNGLGYPWEYMSEIASLPYLKVLKLRCSAFQGSYWETKGRKFRSLKYLLHEDIDVEHWRVQKRLPYLRHLILRHCYKLKKIPYFRDLNRMEVDECSPSVVDYAQQRKDNADASDLEVVINSSWKL